MHALSIIMLAAQTVSGQVIIRYSMQKGVLSIFPVRRLLDGQQHRGSHARVTDHEVGRADVLVQDEAGRAQLQGLLDVGRLAGAPTGVSRAKCACVLACRESEQ